MKTRLDLAMLIAAALVLSFDVLLLTIFGHDPTLRNVFFIGLSLVWVMIMYELARRGTK